jgi:hypothetical protein
MMARRRRCVRSGLDSPQSLDMTARLVGSGVQTRMKPLTRSWRSGEGGSGRREMGPYCKFCGTRCFVPVTDRWPKHIIEAYGRFGLAATCPTGQQLEKQRLGYCWDDVREASMVQEEKG